MYQADQTLTLFYRGRGTGFDKERETNVDTSKKEAHRQLLAA